MEGEIRMELRELVTKLYQEYEVEVEPTFPRVLVRVLPKEQETKGGIILPDYQQNKPTQEGLVLKVFKPFWQTISKVPANFDIKNKDTEIDEKGYPKKVWQESVVKPGDHILFPVMAFGITPVWPLDDGKGDYKLIPEWEILATLTYHGLSLLDEVKDALLEAGHNIHFQAKYLLENFDIIRKDVVPVVISGK